MRVRIIGLGTNWWSARPLDVTDPFCFRRPAWFNSAGLKFGNRLRLCWVYPGQVRFNCNSGFNPEFPQRIIGRMVECNGPNRMHGRTHLLVTRILNQNAQPECYLVTLTERTCGAIQFSRAGWKSDGVQLISVSLRRQRYELITLIRKDDWIKSNLGIWSLSQDATRLELSDAPLGGQE